MARPAGDSIPSGRGSTICTSDDCSRSIEISGEVVYQEPVDDAHIDIAALWAAQGWGGTPAAFDYTVDGVSGDLFIALNGISRTTFVRLDADSLQIKSWYRIGFFVPGPMLLYAGRYMASKSSLNDELAIIDFGDVSGPTRVASIDYNSRGQDLALDPENKRLYVLTRNDTGTEGWVSWIDVTLERRGIWHLENDLGLPAGSAPIGVAYDRASARVIIGCSIGIFACHPSISTSSRACSALMSAAASLTPSRTSRQSMATSGSRRAKSSIISTRSR